MEDDGFTAFVIARQRALQRIAWLLTGDWAAAEDLVSQALAKVWQHWSRIQRHDDPHVYACRVLVNAHASAWRRAWRRELPYSDVPDRGGWDEPSTTVDTRRALLDALGRLPRRQREVLVLRYLEDLSEVQTADIMGVAVGTVKSASAAALARLRDDAKLQPIFATNDTEGHR
jgi:RNA polymerase sigma-70 factor (sigma-E family)